MDNIHKHPNLVQSVQMAMRSRGMLAMVIRIGILRFGLFVDMHTQVECGLRKEEKYLISTPTLRLPGMIVEKIII